LGLPLFFVQSVDRGVLQGRTRFARLAASYQAEMWVRLLIALGLVALGLGVNGAAAGLVFSFGCHLARRTRGRDVACPRPAAMRAPSGANCSACPASEPGVGRAGADQQ